MQDKNAFRTPQNSPIAGDDVETSSTSKLSTLPLTPHHEALSLHYFDVVHYPIVLYNRNKTRLFVLLDRFMKKRYNNMVVTPAIPPLIRTIIVYRIFNISSPIVPKLLY